MAELENYILTQKGPSIKDVCTLGGGGGGGGAGKRLPPINESILNQLIPSYQTLHECSTT